MDVFVSHKLLMYMLFSVTQSIYHCLFCLGIVYFSMNYASLEFCHILKRIFTFTYTTMCTLNGGGTITCC